MRLDNLQDHELSALLGHTAPTRSGRSASDPTEADGTRATERTLDPWSMMGRGETLDQLPVSADIRFTLLSICEEFADRLQLRLTDVLRLPVGIHCGQIVADTFAAYVLAMPQPTCFAVAGMAPLEAKCLVELPCDATFPILERLLGGQPRHGQILPRPLTDFELRILRHVLDVLLSTWSTSWQSVAPFHTVLERIESNPRIVRCISATEPILVARFTIEFTDLKSTMRMAMPIKSAVEACNCRQTTPIDDQLRYRGTAIPIVR